MHLFLNKILFQFGYLVGKKANFDHNYKISLIFLWHIWNSFVAQVCVTSLIYQLKIRKWLRLSNRITPCNLKIKCIITLMGVLSCHSNEEKSNKMNLILLNK